MSKLDDICFLSLPLTIAVLNVLFLYLDKERRCEINLSCKRPNPLNAIC